MAVGLGSFAKLDISASVLIGLALLCVGCGARSARSADAGRRMPMKISVADSLTKVTREPEPGEPPLAPGPVRLQAARNERESFQVVVEAGGAPLRGVLATVSPLAHESGRGSIAPHSILVNPVGYVETEGPAYPVPRVGWWPDPLLPPAPVDVEAERRQPFWITVHVPDDTSPGSYRGRITVSAEGGVEETVELELTVWDFALAPTPPLPSAIALYAGAIGAFHGQRPVSEKTLRSYWDMMFTHRLSSDDLDSPLDEGMAAVIEGREAPPDGYAGFDERLEYCLPRGLTAFQAARLPGFQTEGPDLTDLEQERVAAYLHSFANHLEGRGWLDRAFVMVWDEPKDSYAGQVLKELQTIHQAHPKLRTRLDGPVTGPLVDVVQEEVDIWGLHMLNIAGGGAQAWENIARWRKQNRVLWMYVACDVHHPYPNLFIDYPLVDCRILPWICWKYDFQGFLYWSANFWGGENVRGANPSEKWPNRPWVSANFVNHWGGRTNRFNGDGHLIYPGPDGTALSSVRLEALRDGMEDYEYLWLLGKGVETLRSKGNHEALAAEASELLEDQAIVKSFTEWCKEAEELARARERLAELIVRVQKAVGD